MNVKYTTIALPDEVIEHAEAYFVISVLDDGSIGGLTVVAPRDKRDEAKKAMYFKSFRSFIGELCKCVIDEYIDGGRG